MLLVPFGVSLVRARHVGWLPSGDDALIGLRARDVFSSHRPLIGQPSTSHLYGPDTGTSHPGPIEFYWLAIPIRVLGPATGMVLGSLAVNLASVLIAAWVVFRRAGPAVAAWGAVVLSLALWSQGTGLLSDPISSAAGGVPLLALGALAWAVIDGDLRLLPLAALVGSWVAQQHLSIVAPAATLVGLAALGAAVPFAWEQWQQRRRAPSAASALDETIDAVWPEAEMWSTPSGEQPHQTAHAPSRWPWVVGALVVALVCWSPVLWQQVSGDPGNIGAVVNYARTSQTPSIGKVAGLRQAVRAMGSPPIITRCDLTGDQIFQGPLHPSEVVLALAAYAALCGVVVSSWRRRRTLALLALTSLVLAAGGVVNGASIPASIEAWRISFYRWTFVVAWLGWTALGWAGAVGARSLLARRQRPVPERALRFAPVFALAVLLVPTVATVVAHPGWDDERRDEVGFPMMRKLSDAALTAAEGHGAVTLALRGSSANLSTGPAIALQLEAAGHPVRVPDQDERFYGPQRILEPGEQPADLILLVSSGLGKVGNRPGRLLARVSINDRFRKALGRLVAQAEGAKPNPSAEADEILARHYGARDIGYVRDVVMPKITSTPAKLLTDPTILQVLIDGYFDEPGLDRTDLLTMQRSLPAKNVNLDDVFEIRVISAAELATVVPQWGDG